MSELQADTTTVPLPNQPGTAVIEFAHKPLPYRALIIAVAALAAPALLSFLAPEWVTSDAGALAWLVALVPAFLFAYYKGWQGVSIAAASGLVLLISVQVAFLLTGLSEPDWGILLWVVIVYVGLSLGLGALAHHLHRARYEAERLALTDTLTSLPNRRHATLILKRAFAAAARGVPVCVALFDLDRFKDFNDRYGHVAGDEVLRIFGEVLTSYTRARDLSSRYGGEEFLCVLLDSDEEGARVFAERVRRRLNATELPFGPITVSCGVVPYKAEMDTIEDLVAAADRALYTAKKAGRDRVVLASSRPLGALTRR